MPQINKPTNYFNTVLYTGNGGTKSVTGVGFQPDWCWIKSRSNPGTYGHEIYDSIRGVRNVLQSSTTAGEFTIPSTSFESFDSDGFTVQLSDNYGRGVNENNQLHVGWNWLAGGTGVSNTDGSITSTVSANTTSGFSIVTYTGTGSAATVGHGLGVKPRIVIIKNRNSATNWSVYSQALVDKTGNNSSTLVLNNTAGDGLDGSYFNSTQPTSSVFSIGSNSGVSGSGNSHIAYCFAEKKGFSKFGSYVGNNSSDGVFCYTGFKPAFILVKNTQTTVNSWEIHDNKRDTFNVGTKRLYPNANASEGSGTYVDMLSNGFKWRSTDGGHNSANTFIYMAFAETPLVGTNNVPTTAR